MRFNIEEKLDSRVSCDLIGMEETKRKWKQTSCMGWKQGKQLYA